VAEAIVVTAEFRLNPGHVDEWLQLMLDHYGPACVEERGMLRYWLHHDDDDPAHILLYEQWADRADFDASHAPHGARTTTPTPNDSGRSHES